MELVGRAVAAVPVPTILTPSPSHGERTYLTRMDTESIIPSSRQLHGLFHSLDKCLTHMPSPDAEGPGENKTSALLAFAFYTAAPASHPSSSYTLKENTISYPVLPHCPPDCFLGLTHYLTALFQAGLWRSPGQLH